jgi:hypothetical protein
MFTTQHDVILLTFAAMFILSYIAHVVALAAGRVDRAPGNPLYIAVLLVIIAALW